MHGEDIVGDPARGGTGGEKDGSDGSRAEIELAHYVPLGRADVVGRRTYATSNATVSPLSGSSKEKSPGRQAGALVERTKLEKLVVVLVVVTVVTVVTVLVTLVLALVVTLAVTMAVVLVALAVAALDDSVRCR